MPKKFIYYYLESLPPILPPSFLYLILVRDLILVQGSKKNSWLNAGLFEEGCIFLKYHLITFDVSKESKIMGVYVRKIRHFFAIQYTKYITMRTNLPKLLDLLICIYSLNFSLEFFIMIFFVTNQLNISKFLPLQIYKTLFFLLIQACTN